MLTRIDDDRWRCSECGDVVTEDEDGVVHHPVCLGERARKEIE